MGYYPTFESGTAPAAFTEARRAELEARGFRTAATDGAVAGDGSTASGATSSGDSATPTTSGGATLLYSRWYFPDPLAGVVFRGLTRGNLYRLACLDEGGPSERGALVENAGTIRGTDKVLASPQDGLVLVASPSGKSYRVHVDDVDPDNPQLKMVPVDSSALRAGDVAFAAAGFGIVLTGRTNAGRYLVRLVDEGGWTELTMILGEWA